MCLLLLGRQVDLDFGLSQQDHLMHVNAHVDLDDRGTWLLSHNLEAIHVLEVDYFLIVDANSVLGRVDQKNGCIEIVAS